MIYEDLICGFELFHVLIYRILITALLLYFFEELFFLFLNLMKVLCSLII